MSGALEELSHACGRLKDAEDSARSAAQALDTLAPALAGDALELARHAEDVLVRVGRVYDALDGVGA